MLQQLTQADKHASADVVKPDGDIREQRVHLSFRRQLTWDSPPDMAMYGKAVTQKTKNGHSCA